MWVYSFDFTIFWWCVGCRENKTLCSSQTTQDMKKIYLLLFLCFSLLSAHAQNKKELNSTILELNSTIKKLKSDKATMSNTYEEVIEEKNRVIKKNTNEIEELNSLNKSNNSEIDKLKKIIIENEKLNDSLTSIIEAKCAISTINVSGRCVLTIKIGNLEVLTEDLEVMNWDGAMKACENLGDGWRLPTSEELEVLFENWEKIGGFKNMENGYWHSAKYGNLDRDGYSWTAEDPADDGTFKASVRAVRALP